MLQGGGGGGARGGAGGQGGGSAWCRTMSPLSQLAAAHTLQIAAVAHTRCRKPACSPSPRLSPAPPPPPPPQPQPPDLQLRRRCSQAVEALVAPANPVRLANQRCSRQPQVADAACRVWRAMGPGLVGGGGGGRGGERAAAASDACRPAQRCMRALPTPPHLQARRPPLQRCS